MINFLQASPLDLLHQIYSKMILGMEAQGFQVEFTIPQSSPHVHHGHCGT